MRATTAVLSLWERVLRATGRTMQRATVARKTRSHTTASHKITGARADPASVRWALVALGVALAQGALAQTVVETREVLAAERTEAWAMRYMSAATHFSGFGVAVAQEPGSVRFGVELGHVPHVSTERRRVGLNGTKIEDLNKSPLFGRVRAWIGLPADLTLELAWTPPLEVDGVRPHRMFGAALERPLWQRGRWLGSLRLAHRRGEVHGDITCSRATAAEPAFSPGNPFGCRAPSRDRFRDHSTGLEIGSAWALADGRTQAFASYAQVRADLSTQVDAELSATFDRSRLDHRGWLRTASIGLQAQPRADWEWLAALQWTPLEVRRGDDLQARDDDLWSLRVMVRRRVR